jgi:hypothetical protein
MEFKVPFPPAGLSREANPVPPPGDIIPPANPAVILPTAPPEPNPLLMRLDMACTGLSYPPTPAPRFGVEAAIPPAAGGAGVALGEGTPDQGSTESM